MVVAEPILIKGLAPVMRLKYIPHAVIHGHQHCPQRLLSFSGSGHGFHVTATGSDTFCTCKMHECLQVGSAMSILRALRAPRCHTALLRERPWPRGAQAEHRRGACRCDRRNGFLPICCFLRRVCEDPSASRGLFQASQALQRCCHRLVWHAFTARTNSQPSPILKAVARALHPSLAAALANGSPTAAPACAGHRLGWRCFVYMRSYCENHSMNNTRATGSLV